MTTTTDDHDDALDPEAEQVIPFATFLQDHRGGVLHAELTEGFRELIGAVVEHAKKGELTLRVKVAPESGQVIVTGEVMVKAPKGGAPVAIYFVDDDHNLHREDPNQQKFELREVPRQPGTTTTEASAQ